MKTQTLSQALNQLKDEGYKIDFNLSTSHLTCSRKKIKLSPSEFTVDKMFRFEGESDPADSAVLYAVSSKKNDLKGVLVNGFGAYADPIDGAMAAKLAYTDTTPVQGL